MMKNYVVSIKINQNPNWLCVLDHSYRILVIRGSGSSKTNVIELNKNSTTRYWQKLFICQRSIRIKAWIAD